MAKEDKLVKVLEELTKEVRLVRETLEKMAENRPHYAPPPPSYLEESQWNCPPPNYVGDWVYTPRSPAVSKSVTESVNNSSNSPRTLVE